MLFELWTRLILRLSNHVIVHSKTSRQILISDYCCPIEKISVIGHGVTSMPMLKTTEARDLLGLSGHPIVLSLGFLHEKKGLETLLTAMSRVRTFHPSSLLVIAGGSHRTFQGDKRGFEQYVSKLAQIVKEFGLEKNVLLRTQYVPDGLLPTYLCSADVVALPYIEGFGGSGILALAMATGRAVVATRVNPFLESIRHRDNGLLVDSKDDQQLADALLELFSDETLRESLGACLMKDSHDLVWSIVAEKHLQVYSRLVGEL